MPKTDCKIFPDNPAVARAFANDFCEWVKSQPADKPKLTVALSGGSTPKLLFQELAKNFADKIDWSRVHFFWGDERCVPPDDSESNYGMTKELLLDHIDIPTENIHRVLGESAPAEERVRCEQEIIEHVAVNDAGVPQFDLMILGMGGDGHTASIFPHEIELLESDNVCEVATHPESGQKRITLTGKVLNASARVAFLITGAGKASVMAEIIGQTGDWQTYPAAHIKNSGPLVFYLDEAAANEIDPQRINLC
jgi:6-phosphogluconolactonase